MNRLATAPKARLESRGNGRFALAGEIGFDNAATMLAEGLQGFGSDGPVEVDLGGVTHADSAGVALLIEWVASLRDAGRELRYSAIPGQVLAIARLGGVDGFLPKA
ncbi:MAG: STAS domain-containing protein [Steroidobacteraceae bacterium]|nr:STAS domain-containing protein [Steroidobacteraceae bacterium]